MAEFWISGQTPRDSISAALSCETLLNIAAYGDRATDGSAITATWIISSTNSTFSNVKRQHTVVIYS